MGSEMCIRDSGIFDLTKEKSRNFTMVVFFRGLHCPICINYLSELARLQSEFFDNGVNQIVISSDDKTRSEETASLIKADQIRYGYDLSIPVAREWGLYISKGEKIVLINLKSQSYFLNRVFSWLGLIIQYITFPCSPCLLRDQLLKI